MIYSPRYAGEPNQPHRPRITDPLTHPRTDVSLCVAAEFLGLDQRTVLVRIDQGRLQAWRDGKLWRINVLGIAAYDAQRRRASSVFHGEHT